MDEPTLREIRELKETLQAVSRRLEHLEQQASRSISPSPQAAKPTLSIFRRVQTAQATRSRSTSSPGSGETLETRIGRDWLNRIGIVTLVLGVAFFILYAFQYIGPVSKLIVGFTIAMGLLGLGVKLERRTHLRWYAQGLIGGGWALLYFTTYAMHHVPAVRILESAWIDLLLLLGVAAGAARHSLHYRSETITALALLLGFITVSISQITYFTLLASALLVGTLAWLVVRLQWRGLYLYGVVASYATYVLWLAPQIHLSQLIAVPTANVAEAEFWLKAGFLTTYWAVYHVVLFALDEGGLRQRNALLTATLVNALAFVQTMLLGMTPVYTEWRYLLLLGVGASYVLSEPFTRRRALPTISTAQLLLGLIFLTLAIPLKLSGQWVSALWVVEVVLFVWLGLRYARWPYRVFAMALAIVMLGHLVCLDVQSTNTIVVWRWVIPWRLLIGGIGIGTFGLSAVSYRLPQYRGVLRSIESQAFRFYFTAAALVMATLLFVEVNSPWLAMAWALESAGIVLCGVWMRDQVVRLLGAIGNGIVGLLVASTMMLVVGGGSGEWNRVAAAWVVGILYGMSGVYRWMPIRDRAMAERHFQDGYAIVASILLTALLWLEVNRQWLSIAWAVEGLAIVATGFVLKDRVLRVSGLVVFGLLVLKILFVDLAGAETIYRILSFIVAGIILLVASYTYARFSGKGTLQRKS